MKNINLPLKLDRPLAIFDIESTGPTPRADRIIEIAIIKLFPDGSMEEYVFRVKPEIPIPPESTEIHGITDADVAGLPTFGELAPKLIHILENCDLSGYNVIRFDIPMLVEEFERVGYHFELEGRRIIDAQRIFHKREPRDLSAALNFYCNEEHLEAHGAIGDALATLKVLGAQLLRYPDLPRNIDELDKYCNQRPSSWVDREGKLKWENGEIVLNFTKNKGKSLREIINHDPNLLKWLLNSDLPRDMKEIIHNCMKGNWPSPPTLQ